VQAHMAAVFPVAQAAICAPRVVGAALDAAFAFGAKRAGHAWPKY
jgi:hypothetical protein